MPGVTSSGAHVRLFVEQNMRSPEVYPLASGISVTFSATCPGVERGNEDGAAVIPIDAKRGVLAVADGLGGQPAGARAARLSLECLAESLEPVSTGETGLREAILNGIEAGNRRVLDLGIGAGTTMAVAEIREHTARTYHVGDSEVLIVGQRGKIRHCTVPHSPVGYGVEAGLIGRTEALDHEDRHLLSNVVGSGDMRIEIGPVVPLRPRDVVLIATDGLVDNLHADEIVETIRKGKLAAAARSLSRSSGERMRTPLEGRPSKPDDLTFVLFRRTAS